MYDEESYLSRRIQSWRRLQELSTQAGIKVKSLTGPEIVEFTRLYRQASGDLAYLMTHSSNQDVVAYLNSVVSQAYGQLYRHRPKRSWPTLVSNLQLAARTARKHSWAWWLSFAVFFVSGAWTWGFMALKPETKSYFVPVEFKENFDQWKEAEFEPRTSDEGLMAAGFYASHNPTVAIMEMGAAAGTAGIGSTVLNWQNGMLLGALSAEMASVGKLGFLYSSIGPHGVSEMGGFVLCGAGGYVLAGAILVPGRRRRSDALREAGKDVIVLFVTALIMIFMAAPIEGFFSFNPAVPQSLKGAVAITAFLAWSGFFMFFGREQPDELEATEAFA